MFWTRTMSIGRGRGWLSAREGCSREGRARCDCEHCRTAFVRFGPQSQATFACPLTKKSPGTPAARMASASGAVLIRAMFSQIVPSNNSTVCETKPTCRPRSSGSHWSSAAPSSRTPPLALAAPGCTRIGQQWDRCGVYYVEPNRESWQRVAARSGPLRRHAVTR
jgi:hypothetical protein